MWISLKKIEVVKKEQEFNTIIKHDPYVKNKAFVIYIRKTETGKRHFGLAVSKKLGNAVVRNKIKRQLRAILDELKENFPNNHDYIIMIKKSCVELSFFQKKSDLENLIKEIK